MTASSGGPGAGRENALIAARAPKLRSMNPANAKPVPIHIDMLQILPEKDWAANKPVLEELNKRQISYAVGGGLVVIMYGGHARATKDMDLFIDPRDSEAVIDVLIEHGFEDLYARQRYRRDWIYRGIKGDVILDVIWSMANRRADVSWDWFNHVTWIDVDGVRVPLMAPEELVWAKMYVMHRDRCDWPDLLNLLNAHVPSLNWERLLSLVGEDWMLLASLLIVFRWLCPKASEGIPREVLEKLDLADTWARPVEGDEGARAHLLDSYRDWFGPLRPEEVVERRMG
jgi:hypothetical protein